MEDCDVGPYESALILHPQGAMNFSFPMLSQ